MEARSKSQLKENQVVDILRLGETVQVRFLIMAQNNSSFIWWVIFFYIPL